MRRRSAHGAAATRRGCGFHPVHWPDCRDCVREEGRRERLAPRPPQPILTAWEIVVMLAIGIAMAVYFATCTG